MTASKPRPATISPTHVIIRPAKPKMYRLVGSEDALQRVVPRKVRDFPRADTGEISGDQ